MDITVPKEKLEKERINSTFGWSFCHLDTGKRNKQGNCRRTYYCLGVYKCPVEGCQFVEFPRQLRRGKRFGAPPPPAKYKCQQHDIELDHLACTGGDPSKHPKARDQRSNPPCSMITVTNENNPFAKVHHYGTHNHPKPPIKYPTSEGKKKLEELVLANPTAGPAKLKMGVGNAPPADSIDPAFMNQDRIKYERQKILNKDRPKGIQGGIGPSCTTICVLSFERGKKGTRHVQS